MRHNKKRDKLSRKSSVVKPMMYNLATQIIMYEAIETTEARAKLVKKYLEPLITRAKVDNLANHRYMIARLRLKKAIAKLFKVLGPRYVKRNGGYTRIIKIGQRAGDNALKCRIELV